MKFQENAKDFTASQLPAGSDPMKFPLKFLQIRLEASLGLWKTFKKPAAIVRDLQNPQNLTACQKVVPKRRKNEVRKKV